MTRKLIGMVLLLFVGGFLADAWKPACAQATPDRVLAWRVSVKGDAEVELRAPIAAAAASDQEFAVADTVGPRILVFQQSGLAWQYTRSVDLPAVPVDLTHDGSRYIASLRQGGGLIALEGEGLSIQQLDLPKGVFPGPVAASDNGELFVYDYAGERVLHVSPTGSILARISVPSRVSALAAMPHGGFLAAHAEEQRISRFGPTGELELSFEMPDDGDRPSWPVGLSVDPNGEVLVLDRYNGRILAFTASGNWIGIASRRGWEPGLLLYPASISRISDSLVVVADQGNGRAQIFERIGVAPAE